MMEKKRILEEGLLEQYLTGELSRDEQMLIEKALREDTDLKAQFDQLEADFERMAFEQAIEPPKNIKSNLIQKMNDYPNRKINWRPVWIAASITLFFGIVSFWMYGKWQDSEGNLKLLQEQTVDLQQRMELLENEYLQTATQLKRINNPTVIPLVLYGNKKSPSAKVIAYVDHNQKTVLINSQGLPELPDSKTYQMWSDVEGEMINMGTLSPSKDLVTLKYIDKAESLNITVEPSGGNDHPTVEELISYVTL